MVKEGFIFMTLNLLHLWWHCLFSYGVYTVQFMLLKLNPSKSFCIVGCFFDQDIDLPFRRLCRGCVWSCHWWCHWNINSTALTLPNIELFLVPVLQVSSRRNKEKILSTLLINLLKLFHVNILFSWGYLSRLQPWSLSMSYRCLSLTLGHHKRHSWVVKWVKVKYLSILAHWTLNYICICCKCYPLQSLWIWNLSLTQLRVFLNLGVTSAFVDQIHQSDLLFL